MYVDKQFDINLPGGLLDEISVEEDDLFLGGGVNHLSSRSKHVNLPKKIREKVEDQREKRKERRRRMKRSKATKFRDLNYLF